MHCFDPGFPTYRRIAALSAVRSRFPMLRKGRQYLRPIALFGGAFLFPGAGDLVAWSRILSDEEALCIVNAHGTEARGGDVLIDASLNPPGAELAVIANTVQAASDSVAQIAHPLGSRLPVKRTADGTAYVEIRAVPASEVLVLVNHA